MVAIVKMPLTAAKIKSRAKELGADLVGIADGAALEANQPGLENDLSPTVIVPVT